MTSTTGKFAQGINIPCAFFASLFDWERYSAWQDVKMMLGGFVGEVEYMSEVSEFVSLLKLGERLRERQGYWVWVGQIRNPPLNLTSAP